MIMGKHRKPEEGEPDLRNVSAGKRRHERHAKDGWHIESDGERNAGSDALPRGLRPEKDR